MHESLFCTVYLIYKNQVTHIYVTYWHENFDLNPLNYVSLYLDNERVQI